MKFAFDCPYNSHICHLRPSGRYGCLVCITLYTIQYSIYPIAGGLQWCIQYVIGLQFVVYDIIILNYELLSKPVDIML